MLVNVLLVRWAGGWEEVRDEPSITAHGRAEGYLDLGAQESLSEAVRLSRAHMDDAARIRTQATVDVAPLGAADKPVVAFTIGDFVNVPNWAGASQATRVVAIGGAVDEDGYVSFSVDISDQEPT
jgi:hypothetical protein